MSYRYGYRRRDSDVSLKAYAIVGVAVLVGAFFFGCHDDAGAVHADEATGTPRGSRL